MSLPIPPAHARTGRRTAFSRNFTVVKGFRGCAHRRSPASARQTRRPFIDQSKVDTPLINGHMIALGAGHSSPSTKKTRECYVAEFLDGGERLEYAGSWFRFNAGALRCYNGRAALRSSMPLTRRCCRESSDSTLRARLAKRGCWLCHGGYRGGLRYSVSACHDKAAVRRRSVRCSVRRCSDCVEQLWIPTHCGSSPLHRALQYLVSLPNEMVAIERLHRRAVVQFLPSARLRSQ